MTYTNRLLQILAALVLVFVLVPLVAVAITLTTNSNATDLEAGSSQYWSIADQAALDFTTNYTLMAWVKPESQPAADTNYGIISKFNASPNLSYMFSYFNNAGTLQVRLAASDDGTGVTSCLRNQTLSDATWYHVAATFSGSSGSNRTRLYVDGTQVGTDCTPGFDTFSGTSAFTVGAGQALASTFDGIIDDARVWSRELTATEISDIKNSPCSASDGASIQGQWLFDNDGTDQTANAFTLTNNNTATFVTDVAYSCASDEAGSNSQVNFIGI